MQDGWVGERLGARKKSQVGGQMRVWRDEHKGCCAGILKLFQHINKYIYIYDTVCARGL